MSDEVNIIHRAVARSGRLELALGNLEAAGAYLARHSRAGRSRADTSDPTAPFWARRDRGARRGLGQLDRAERLTALLRARWASAPSAARRRWLRRSAVAAAILAARAGELEQAEGALKSALVYLERALGSPLESRTDPAPPRDRVERRRRSSGLRARVTLERSLAICEEIGAKAWAERARVRARPPRASERAAPGELTETERRVCRARGVRGLTNREIAAAAFMSQKTVEANLSRIYRKLGIRSRGGLAVGVGRVGA